MSKPTEATTGQELSAMIFIAPRSAIEFSSSSSSSSGGGVPGGESNERLTLLHGEWRTVRTCIVRAEKGGASREFLRCVSGPSESMCEILRAGMRKRTGERAEGGEEGGEDDATDNEEEEDDDDDEDEEDDVGLVTGSF